MQQSVDKPFTVEESSGGAREWEYLISRLIGKAYTATLVKIVDSRGLGLEPVGFVDAVDLIQQVDGSGEGIPNAVMLNLPYFRLQGGSNAVIIDPKPGDIGIAVFAQRDISELKTSKKEGKPPSLRSHDVSDGLYIGGVLNGAPTQWMRFLDSGIDVVATGKISYSTPGDFEINASSFNVNAATTIDGTVAATQTIVAGADVSAMGGVISMSGIASIYNSHTHPDQGTPVPVIPT